MKNRLIYLDLLRIVAIVSMILLHVAAQNLKLLEPASLEWQVFNVYDSLARFCAPIFVMISGALLLDPNKFFKAKLFLKKHLLKIVIVLVFWNLFYAIFMAYYKGDSFHKFCDRLVNGHYHLWYLYMLAGLYLLTPLVRKIAADKKLCQYYLFVWFIIAIFLPSIELFLQYFDVSNKYVLYVYNALQTINAKGYLATFTGYLGYFILGHYIRTTSLTKTIRNVIYALGAIGAVSTILLSSTYSIELGEHSSMFYYEFTPNVFLSSLALFVFFQYKFGDNDSFGAKKAERITFISNLSLGAYLIHDFYITLLGIMGLTPMSLNPIISVPLITLIVALCSFATSFIFSKIPLLKKVV